MTILEKAAERLKISLEKHDGNTRESFERIAKIWSIILNKAIAPHEVALCMIGLKLSRQIHSYNEDNLVDLCGYAVCCERIASEKFSAPHFNDCRIAGPAECGPQRIEPSREDNPFTICPYCGKY